MPEKYSNEGKSIKLFVDNDKILGLKPILNIIRLDNILLTFNTEKIEPEIKISPTQDII